MTSFVRSDYLHVPHAFSTRQGGVSEGVYHSFNLGLSTGDAPDKVAKNRRMWLDSFGVKETQVCALEQIHSANVIEAKAGWFKEKADASVSNDPDLLLLISTADCLPIVFHDPKKKAIGAAHAGWRGTALGISRQVVVTMRELYGSSPEDIRVVIGPCIKGACYQVGPEVIEHFQAANFPQEVYEADSEGRYRLDLPKANRWLLASLGLSQIFSIDECTHCDETRYYSHRRDGLKRGSHWSGIKLS